ncbi:tRNA pseudouridine(55) synthase TruB [Pacificimonas flava]|uniref:tRNA pseudouridine synthase B n=2 Tax=Pacificimonas TaxID=1960290 RepID=A0A219B1C8_9SPHN|nr:MULTISPECIES: tRNA pseudouridine(55) synthase TruB [Pacificimonas]MBZ6378227.1 tRNA pseudouridine(55) synthase TruB [Pacificimonas aurantium]OWV32147.1 tRNA pseudouridine(55) synthase TruB [Pacificimonas flava]
MSAPSPPPTGSPASLHGWIILDKPLGITSAHGVAKVKRLMRAEGLKKPKVGHGGTLDPLATGVLPIALGEATKLTGRMLNGDKAYDFTIAFGTATATDDAEGEIVATSDVRPTCAEVESVLPSFTGPIRQHPPAYSALKVDGERAYARARRGEDVDLPAREVTVHALGTGDALPTGPLDAITLSARVSKGTYIRSLARDIADALGTAGHVSMLRRTQCGPFDLENAISVDMLERRARERGLGSMVLPMTAGLDDIPALSVTPRETDRLMHGQRLEGRPEPDGSYIAMDGNTPVALVSLCEGTVSIDRGFNF